MQLQVRDYDTIQHEYTNESLIPDINIWFKGNLVIQEIKSIKVTDFFGHVTKETPIAYYLFMDRASKAFYNYSSFSDTARILDNYIQSDTAEIKGLGGWSFYGSHDFNIVESPRALKDTLIKGIIYRRLELIMNMQTSTLTAIGYLRCDKKGTMFQFDKDFSNRMGCPLVRIEYLPSLHSRIPTSDEIVFIRDSLTKEERKVFDAWQKNLKKYPVNK